MSRKQKKFRTSQAKFRGFVGGRGAGKSHIGAYDLLVRAQPGRLYLVSAPTYDMLRDASLRSFCHVGLSLGFIRPEDIRRNPPSCRLTTGAEVIFRSADDPNRLRGPNLSGAWLDEASQMDVAAYEIVIAALREGGDFGWLSATFTPRGKRHWTYEVFGTNRPDTELIHAHSLENPFLPKEFVKTVERQYGSGSILARQELGGEFLTEGGCLFQTQWFNNFEWITNAGPGFEGLVALDTGRNYLRGDLSIIACCDPSLGKEHSDDCGIIIAAVPSDRRRLFVLHAVAEKIPLELIVPRLDRLCREWRFDTLLMEANGFQVALAKSARSSLPCVVREVKPEGKSKLARATPAIELASTGDILLPSSALWIGAWLSEHTEWTATDGERDNQVDCTAYVVLEFMNRRFISDDASECLGAGESHY